MCCYTVIRNKSYYILTKTFFSLKIWFFVDCSICFWIVSCIKLCVPKPINKAFSEQKDELTTAVFFWGTYLEWHLLCQYSKHLRFYAEVHSVLYFTKKFSIWWAYPSFTRAVYLDWDLIIICIHLMLNIILSSGLLTIEWKAGSCSTGTHLQLQSHM